MATNVDQWKWCQICISAVFRNCLGCGQVKWTYLSPSIAPVISSTVFCGMRMPPFFWLQDRQMHYMDVEIGNQASSDNLDKTLWMEIYSLTTKCWRIKKCRGAYLNKYGISYLHSDNVDSDRSWELLGAIEVVSKGNQEMQDGHNVSGVNSCQGVELSINIHWSVNLGSLRAPCHIWKGWGCSSGIFVSTPKDWCTCMTQAQA